MRKVLMIISILAVIAMAVIDLTYDGRIKPDAEYQMVNQHITFGYAGK